jgi:hypothetical protein
MPLAMRLLVAWATVTAVACVAVAHVFALDLDAEHPRVVVASVWSDGQLVARATLAHGGDRDARLDAALVAHPGATLVHESIIGEGPVLGAPLAALAMSFVPGRDGLAVTLGDRTEYVTPDDLLSRQAYDRGLHLGALGTTAGVDLPVAFALVGERFKLPVPDVLEHARLRRFRVVRSVPDLPLARPVTPDTLTIDVARDAAVAAAHFLARGVDADGHFRYLVDAPTNRTMPGYDWPRHAGATYYLAQIAGLTSDPDVASATLRAARLLRDHATVDCGDHRCVGGGRLADVGSTALAVIAFVEVARAKVDPTYAQLIPELTAFLRAQQRSDGEFMHEYDRTKRQPVDVQFLYSTGETALALSRANTLLGDPRDLDAARRALAYLVGPGWTFFGSRYYFGEEHWTCLAMNDLWDRAPQPAALDFCARWQAYGRKLQYADGDTPYDADGAYGVGSALTPRLTPAASRSEAAVATLAAVARAGPTAGAGFASRDELSSQVRRSLAMLIRHQFGTSSRHLMTDPGAVEGAIPASEVDWQVRIDFAQHAGSALVAWLRWMDPSGNTPEKPGQ